MPDVVHVVARAVADDPHTLGVLALADAMEDEPAPVPARPQVFAAAGSESIEAIAPFAELDGAPSLIVYHQRGASPMLAARLAEHSARVAVVADDAGVDPLAQRDLRLLAAAGAVGVATSEGSAARIARLGFGRVARVSPVVAGAQLRAIEPYAPTLHHLEVSLRGPLVLTVDDVASATDAARVVRSFHVLRTYLRRTGHLAIAVPEAPDTSAGALRILYREVWGLRLIDAWAQRLVLCGERAALSRAATVFVTASPAVGDTRHALAAMADGLPVIAPADGSAAEVLGSGALLLPCDAGAALIAEATFEVLHDEARRRRLVRAANDAVARYAPAVVAPQWRDALAA